MQSNENSCIDARSFPQIWALLNQNEREELSRQLYIAKCCKNRQTIWKWGNGKCSPREPLVQEGVCKTVSKFLKVKTTTQTLFPAK